MTQVEELAKKTSATLCLGCGKCTGLCPLAMLGDGLSPRRLVAQALEQLNDLNRTLLDKCLSCGACEERCPEGVQFIEFIKGVRQMLPPMERAHCPHHQVLAEASRLMIDGEPRDDRLDWLTPDLEVADTGDVLLFIGCSPLFDSLYADLGVKTLDAARSAVRLLNKAGVTPAVRKDEVCCGHDLLWSGDLKSFEALAGKTKAMIKESGAKLVLSACAECARTLSIDYEGMGVKVQHFTSWLAENKEKIGLGKANGNGGGTEIPVTFQDPCRLGRHMRVFDEPRELLEDIPGVRLTEMDMSGRDSHCCGTAGFMHCDADSRRMQSARLGEAEKTGAEALVTACPKCLVHFSCARAEDSRRAGLKGDSPRGANIRIEDITVLLDSALKKSSERESGTRGKTSKRRKGKGK